MKNYVAVIFPEDQSKVVDIFEKGEVREDPEYKILNLDEAIDFVRKNPQYNFGLYDYLEKEAVDYIKSKL